MVAAPLVLGAVGFGALGITAGSWAAGWMSAAAIANGGGVAAGSLVAIGQALGKPMMYSRSKQTHLKIVSLPYGVYKGDPELYIPLFPTSYFVIKCIDVLIIYLHAFDLFEFGVALHSNTRHE